jgi:glycosyltransferase involved in cell wall biosynthesis
MKISVVTISFNQKVFLERAIRSVLEQNHTDIEYIVVDPGSTDGSREIVNRYRDRIAHVILERDLGPADGLNRGFAKATGNIYCYLNSDDEFCPGAFSVVDNYFRNNPHADVVCGHANVIDVKGRLLRRVWSDPFRRVQQAYGASIQIQPSTFIRAEAFRRTQGFNVENRIAWDGELMVDLALSGARIEIMDTFLSNFRLHAESITGKGNRDDLRRADFEQRFKKLMGRSWQPADAYVAKFWRLVRQVRHPKAFFERLSRGPVYRRVLK